MGKCFLHGKGGLNPLNFNVVGGTSEPINPKENTIWVNTSKDITSWAFRTEQPSEPSDGMVWIAIGVNSTRAFNVLKKNTIYIYPISAKQYESGEWKDKPTSLYQNDKWEDITQIFYIFQNGEAKVGDFDGVCGSADYYYWNSLIEGSFIKMEVMYRGSTSFSFSEPVDLTSYSKLVFVVSNMNGGTNSICTFIYGVVSSAEDSDYVASKSVPVATTEESNEYILDVSSLSGKYYVKATDSDNGHDGNSAKGIIYISEIRLEN
jgi:hypothetical protein